MSLFKKKPYSPPLALDDAVKILEHSLKRTQQEQMLTLRYELKEAAERVRGRHRSGLHKWWGCHKSKTSSQSELAVQVANLANAIREGLRQELLRDIRAE